MAETNRLRTGILKLPNRAGLITRNGQKMRKTQNDYKTDLLDDLRNDPEYAGHYLSAARRDSKEAFLVALRNVVEARLGVSKVAKETKLNRVSLYRTLSEAGNPTWSTLDALFAALQIEVDFRFPNL